MHLQDTMRMFETRIIDGPRNIDLPIEVEMLQSEIDKETVPTSAEIFQRIELLMLKYPDNPHLAHWKLFTYQHLQCSESAIDQLIIKNYKKFPNYIYGICYFAHLCMKKNEYFKIPEIFNQQFFIQDVYPEQKSFHVSDCVAFATVMVRYFCHQYNFMLAYNYLLFLSHVGANQEVIQPLVSELMVTFPEESQDIIDGLEPDFLRVDIVPNKRERTRKPSPRKRLGSKSASESKKTKSKKKETHAEI